MADNVVKLPLFAKVRALKALPGFERGRTFALTDAIAPQPEGGMGYLVEVLAPRRARVIAWLALGGAIFACDGPLAVRPDRAGDAGITKYDDDKLGFYVRDGGRTSIVGRFSQREADGRFTVTSAQRDTGPYGTGAYDIDEMGAACFLVNWVAPRENGEELTTTTVGDLLDELLQVPYPDALDVLTFRGQGEQATPFERFAAQSLTDAGAEYVRPIAAAHEVDLRRLSSTGLFWTGCDKSDLVDRELDTLQAVEGALNRLVFLERYLGADSSPAIRALSMEQCERAAMSALTDFAAVAADLPRACERPSDYTSIASATASRGGEWDVRTRFAATTERLRAPFGFDYDFDCDARGGVFSIQATVPAASAFPVDGEAARNDARTAYALRLAMVLAAAAFGSSVGIVRAVVTVRERELGGAAIASIEFGRQPFTMVTTPRIQSGDILAADVPVDGIIEMLSPRVLRLERAEGGCLATIEPISPDLPDRSAKMADDGRPLPAALVGPLRADRAADLDIFSAADDPLRDRYHEVTAHIEEGGSSVVRDVADIVDAYDAADALQDSDARPLYCVNMVARVMAGRLDGDEAMRYRKLPDTAFDARSTLCRLLRDQGDGQAALRIAEQLVELAPTSFTAYHSLAMTYRELGRGEDAVRALIEGLKVAVAPTDIAAGYYRLGFLLWQAGDAALGLACYVLVPRGTYFYGEAQVEMSDLMREAHISHAPSADDARGALRSAGIPVAPVPATVEAAASAAIGLVDAGFFDAAGALVHFLATTGVAPNSRDVLPAVLRSLS